MDRGREKSVGMPEDHRKVIARSKQLCERARQEVARSKELQKYVEAAKQRLVKV
jgi:phage shock protein A